MYPLGHFVRKLGPIGDKETENEVLLLEHDVPHGALCISLCNTLMSLTRSGGSHSTRELVTREMEPTLNDKEPILK